MSAVPFGDEIAPDGGHIAQWFREVHWNDWHSGRTADGFMLAHDGENYAYLWVEAFVDCDEDEFVLLDIRTDVGNGETRDFMFVASGVSGDGWTWQRQPIAFDAGADAHMERFVVGMRWFADRIEEHELASAPVAEQEKPRD